MAGKLRYLLALAFAALYFLVPEADHDYLAFLRTRAWLQDEALPASTYLAERETVPRMAAEVQGQTGSLDRIDDYERIVRVWARNGGRDMDGSAPLTLSVAVDGQGFRATLSDPGGAPPSTRDVDGANQWIGSTTLALSRDGAAGYYPDRKSLIPAFLAIALAIITGKVIPSLLIGCLAGALLVIGEPIGALTHFVADTVWAQTLREDFNLRIMGFVMFLFMAVGVMARSGGMQGMVEWVRKLARGPVSTQICSFVIGVLIFFDDYSNCIITGTTMRPLADRNRVSREKLSYIVDSTAAPIAGISIVSTWVAYEISMFRDQLPEVTKTVVDAAGQVSQVAYTASEGFSVFVQTLPYRFYCLFTLMLVLLSILLRREFGPMLRAARRATHEGKPVADDAKPMLARGFAELRAPDDAPIRGRNAFVPVLVLVFAAVAFMGYLGYSAEGREPLVGSMGDRLRTILNHTQSELALFWASALALGVAITMAVTSRVLSVREATGAATRSFGSLIFALVILVLAWSIGNVCKFDLGTAQFLTAAFQGSFAPWLLPVVLFLLSALVAFSTGTSYGTMAILLPNVVVLAHAMGETAPELGGTALMILTIGAVLEGSIFGDHCSPISDTTVLSSVATASDHMHHVQTQAPYAVLAMGVAVVCGYLPMALISPTLWPVSWAAGAGVLVLWLFVFGRNPNRPTPAT